MDTFEGPFKEGYQGRRRGSEGVMGTVGRKRLNTSMSNLEGKEKQWRRTRDQTSCCKAGVSS